MYGINAPAGFIPAQSANNAGIAASEITGTIAATSTLTYGQNIFTGDLVIYQTGNDGVTSTGYIANFFDYLNNYNNTGITVGGVAKPLGNGGGGYPLVGVFAGCSYFSSTDLTNPAAPRRSWFPAGTVSSDGNNATAYIIPLNFDYTFTVQTGAPTGTPRTFDPTMVGKYVKVVYTTNLGVGAYGTSALVSGDTRTGSSMCFVDLSTFRSYTATTAATTTAGAPTVLQDTARDSILIVGIDDKPNAQSILNPQSSLAIPYGNVLVRLTNSAIPMVTNFPQ